MHTRIHTKHTHGHAQTQAQTCTYALVPNCAHTGTQTQTHDHT